MNPPVGHTVVFLLDQVPNPTRVVLLKRAAWKSFAPGLSTGIGGKFEEGETAEQAAYRELEEETGLSDIELTQFARAYCSWAPELYYFWGIAPSRSLPECNEGTLSWVTTAAILRKRIIPTTLTVLQEWSERGFNPDTRYTLWLRGVLHNGIFEDSTITRKEEGLQPKET